MNQSKTLKAVMIGANLNLAYKFKQKFKDIFNLSVDIQVTNSSMNHVKSITKIDFAMIVISKVPHQLSNQAVQKYKATPFIKIEHNANKYLDRFKHFFINLGWIPADFELILESEAIDETQEDQELMDELNYQDMIHLLKNRILNHGKFKNIFEINLEDRNLINLPIEEYIKKHIHGGWKDRLSREINSLNLNIKPEQIDNEQLVFDLTQALINEPQSFKILDDYIESYVKKYKTNRFGFYVFMRLLIDVFLNSSKSFCQHLNGDGIQFLVDLNLLKNRDVAINYVFLKNEVMNKFYDFMSHKEMLNIINQQLNTTMEVIKPSTETEIQASSSTETEIQASSSTETEIQANIEIMDQTVDMISLDGFSLEISNPIEISIIKDQSIYLPKLTKIEVLSYDSLLDRINLRLSQDQQIKSSSNDILQINSTIFKSLDFPFSIQSSSNLKFINFKEMYVNFLVNNGIFQIKFNL
jgi:hypothetical protein